MRKLAIGPQNFKVKVTAEKAYKNSTTAKISMTVNEGKDYALGEIDYREAVALGNYFLEVAVNLKRKK